MGITLENITRSFGNQRVLDGISLGIKDGEFHVILGPSGEGKSTILSIIAGLIEPDSGSVYIANKNADRVPPQKRGIGFVFQDYALFPHLTGYENVAYGLRAAGIEKKVIKKRVKKYLDLVGLGRYQDKYPDTLSGGQKQRVALARALATEPKALLLDEPLSHLDAVLREQLRIELKDIQKQTGITTLYVTHDRAEAKMIADRVSVLHRGRIEKVDTPEDIFNQSGASFSSIFLGATNILNIHVLELHEYEACCRILHPGLQDELTIAVKKYPFLVEKKEFFLCIHPENIKLCKEPEGVNSLLGHVARIEISGSMVEVTVDISGLPLKAVMAKTSPVSFDKEIWVCFHSDTPHPICKKCYRLPEHLRRHENQVR